MGLIASYTVLLVTLSLFTASVAFTPAFNYNVTKVRGVNLGGWLVLEPWITPGIFDRTQDNRIVDEYTFCLYQDRTTSLDALQAHWDSWIQEEDFREIANAGLNHVRIPIGFWAFNITADEPYHSGQRLYLDKAVQWAGKYNLKVIINLHGVPGSQNGFDNSGQRTSDPSWYRLPLNIDRTRAIIRELAVTYMDSSVVTAISVLNEPWPERTQDPASMLSNTTQYYYDSYEDIRLSPGNSQQSNTVVIISDAFQGLDHWKSFMPSSKWEGVMMDIHKYQMFTHDDVQKTNKEHISAACSQREELANSGLWTIVGEWTPAATDCAKYLNGRGVGSRYDGTFDNNNYVGSCVGLTGSAAAFSKPYRKFLKQYWQAQASTYEQGGAGWIQWTWKAENADEWSYQAGLKHGWIEPITVNGESVYGAPARTHPFPDRAVCSSAPERSHSIFSFSGTYSCIGLIFQVIVLLCILW